MLDCFAQLISQHQVNTMSSPIAPKRRRLNDATTTLSKPFRSPLKTTNDSHPKPAAHAPPTPYKSSNLSQTTFSSPISSQEHKGPPTRPVTLISDPVVTAAEHSIRQLESQIRALKADIDALTQANRLRTSSTDLPTLIKKWRTASQEAADELFPGAKAKLDAMGGVKVLLENERRKELGNGWGREGNGLDDFEAEEAKLEYEAEVGYDENGEKVCDAEREERRAKLRRYKKGNSDRMDAQELAEERGFTMDMMLRSLNVEANVVGWDERAQQWVSD